MDIDKIKQGHKLVTKLESINHKLRELNKPLDLVTISFNYPAGLPIGIRDDPDFMNGIRDSCIHRLEKLSKQLTKEIEEL